MIRLLLTMTFSILLGLGTGYFMWGGRVARLTESLSNITLEYDTLRTELASRPARGAETAMVSTATAVTPGQAGNIGEGLAEIRNDLAKQKQILDDQTAVLSRLAESNAGDTCKSELKQTRVELDRCFADKKDLEAGTVRTAPRPAPVPAPTAQPPRPPSFSQPPQEPAPTMREPVPPARQAPSPYNRQAAPPAPSRDPRYDF